MHRKDKKTRAIVVVPEEMHTGYVVFRTKLPTVIAHERYDCVIDAGARFECAQHSAHLKVQRQRRRSRLWISTI